MKRKILSVLLVLSLLLYCGIFTVNADEVQGARLFSTSATSIVRGNSGYFYVSASDMTGIAAMSVTVYFDPQTVKINSANNIIPCTVYDPYIGDDHVTFSYIFDGKSTAQNTNLFYFNYQVLSGSTATETQFDVLVSDVYDAGLNDLQVDGFRHTVKITERPISKTCSFGGTSSVSTAVEKTFDITCNLSTSQIAAGTVTFTYDSDLFEFVSFTGGKMLSDRTYDVNPDTVGTVYLSFVGNKNATSTGLCTLKFKTKKNIATTSQIIFSAQELCNQDLEELSCQNKTVKVNVSYDSTYLGDKPSVRASVSHNPETDTARLTVSLDANTKLGAGDFVLYFDATEFEYLSAEKLFKSTFFTVDDKKVTEGILMFHIISVSDIKDAGDILAVDFKVKPIHDTTAFNFDLQASDLTDSLTRPIILNIIDTQIEIAGEHIFDNACDPTCNECDFTRPTAHQYVDGECVLCGDHPLWGDISGDNSLDATDLVLLRRILLGIDETTDIADANNDGKVDIRDLVRMKKLIAKNTVSQ